MSNKIRVLKFTQLYPSHKHAIVGIARKHECFFLSQLVDLRVVRPINAVPPLAIFHSKGWMKRLRHWWRSIYHQPNSQVIDGYPIYYPKVWFLPKVWFFWIEGFFHYVFCYKTIRKVYSEYPFDIIHSHVALPAGHAALFVNLKYHVPLIVHIHGQDVYDTARRSPLNRLALKHVLARCNIIIVDSDAAKRETLKYCQSVEKIKVIPSGYMPAIRKNMHSKRDPNCIVLVTTAFLIPRKGHAFVLRAIEKLRSQYPIKYIIIGYGPEEARLRALTKELSLEEVVHFAGGLDHEKVFDIMSQADIFVLPSWNEALGIAYLEALSLEIPFIGCKGEGCEEILKFGRCGLLVQPRDVDSLESAIRYLCENKDIRQEMGSMGAKIVAEHFGWERHAKKLVKVYEMLLEKKLSTELC